MPVAGPLSAVGLPTGVGSLWVSMAPSSLVEAQENKNICPGFDLWPGKRSKTFIVSSECRREAIKIL